MLRGSTLVRRHLERSLFNVRRWRVQKVAAHQSRVEVDLGRLSHHEWSGNSKADEMGMRWFQVMSAPMDRRGIRLQIWPTFCVRLLCVGP